MSKKPDHVCASGISYDTMGGRRECPECGAALPRRRLSDYAKAVLAANRQYEKERKQR
jgi:hypothetical protein